MRPKKPQSISVFSLSRPGQQQLVLHDAVLARRPSSPRAASRERVAEVLRDRLLAIDVLAGGDRLVQQLGAQLGRGGIEEQRVVGVRRAPRRDRWSSARCRAPWPVARACLRCGRPGSGRASPCRRSRSATPPLRADRQNRADEVLVHPHAPGDAVHDDAETLLRHAQIPFRCRMSDVRAEMKEQPACPGRSAGYQVIRSLRKLELPSHSTARR